MRFLVSIIVPIYNGEEFLKETIETVINQTYNGWELLLIDDGSTDNSKKICLDFVNKDNRIKYFYKTNGGQASARNLGINKSQGEWIALLDADDLWHETKIEKQVSVVLNNPEVAICFTNTVAFETNITKEIYNFDTKNFGLLSDAFFLEAYTSSYMSNSSLMIKKSIVENEGGYDESEVLRGSEDWDLLLKLLLNGNRIYGLKDRLFYYRIHDGGIHLQNARMFIGKTIVYKKYHNLSSLGRLRKLRQYRYTYRELLNYLFEEERIDEIKLYSKEIWRLDRLSFVTLAQKIIFSLFSIKKSLWISNKIIYRIGYRIENLKYKIFLNE
jgi:glycosyltransferase involved in cell wall biosynthesis